MRTWVSSEGGYLDIVRGKRKQYFWLQWCEVGGGDNWNQVPPDLTGDGDLSLRYIGWRSRTKNQPGSSLWVQDLLKIIIQYISIALHF